MFLGIEVDSKAGCIRLPKEKLEREGRDQRVDRKEGLHQEGYSVTDRSVTECILCGETRWTVLRQMINLSTTEQIHHHIQLNRGFRLDLSWWAAFLPSWNGISMLAGWHNSPIAGTIITSDASGSWGNGACSSQGSWFQLNWPEFWSSVRITVKELLPIIVVTALCGSQWK